jgi:hypothetical protein
MSSANLGALLTIALGLLVLCAALFPSLSPSIVKLELPFTAARAREVIAAWTAANKMGAARRAVMIDFVFIALYVTVLAAAGVLASRWSGWDDGSTLFIVAAVVTGVLDVVENGGILLMLGGRLGSVPALTTFVSAVKWALAAVTVICVPLAAAGVLG